jgi:hypothetical protein
MKADGSKKTQKKKVQNQFVLRVYDNDVLTNLTELFATGQFESMNELLNKALCIGAEKIYLDFGKKRALTGAVMPEVNTDSERLNEILKRTKAVELTVDDVFVMMTAMEMLLSTVYNIEESKVEGKPVSIDMMQSGMLSVLPEHVRIAKERLQSRFSKRKENKK